MPVTHMVDRLQQSLAARLYRRYMRDLLIIDFGVFQEVGHSEDAMLDRLN